MKRIALIIMAICLMAATVTGCGGNSNQTSQTQIEDKTMEQQAETPSGQENGEASKQTEKIPAQTTPQDVDTSKFIGEEKAKEIALQKAELTADGVIFDRVELDRDNGVWQYEVEFTKDGKEYNADIKAEDGTILEWDVDLND